MTLHENYDHLDELFRADRFAALIGVELDTWSGGAPTATASVVSDSCNFAGGAHGGYIFSAADIVASVASNSWGRKCVAASIDIEYIRGATDGEILRFMAIELGKGRSLATYRVEAHRDEVLIASASAVTFRTPEWHLGSDAWSHEWRSTN